MQSHSHVHVPSASCPADVAEAGGDIAGVDGVPELDVGAEDVEGAVEGDRPAQRPQWRHSPA